MTSDIGMFLMGAGFGALWTVILCYERARRAYLNGRAAGREDALEQACQRLDRASEER